jgi:hypothetical protein
MKKLDLQKIIREEVKNVLKTSSKKSLKETYRDPKENVAILHGMLKKGGKDAKRAKDIIKDIKDELSVIMSTTDPKANLKLVNKVTELDEYLDDAIEMALDDGMGRFRGMMGGISGMREATATKMEEMGDDQFMESKKPSKSKKSLKEGYAWERSERKFGQPLPTLASVQKAYQAKQSVSEVAAIPAGPGRMSALRANREYSILDAGTDEYNEYKYLGEIGQGSTAGNPGEHMFYATDAPGVYVFVALSEEDLKTMVKPL